MKNYKFKIKKAALVCFSAFCILPSALAVYLQPFLYYGRDQFGFAITNAITIDAWPPTNSITGNSTNIVISVPHTFLPDPNGFVSNNIALGNYRVVITGFSPGVPFSVSSNAAPVVISQTANIPVTTFMNFTIAQFADAGTMAYENTNSFIRNSFASVFALFPFAPATNSYPGITNALGYIPTTNNYAGVTNALGFGPATNNYAGVTNALGFGPATNSYPGITNALGYVPTTNNYAGVTNSLGFGPATNSYNGITNAIGLAPATNSPAGIKAALLYTPQTNYVGQSGAVAFLSTNGFAIWVSYQTNAVPGTAFTNLPAGSLMTTTNGALFVLTNLVWIAK